jgi:hypothetical protein
MALPDSAQITTGQRIVLADATDWPGGGSTLTGWGDDDVQLDWTSLAAGAARQSAKVDFGANWEQLFSMYVACEFATDPTAGDTIDFYMGFTDTSGANGTGLPANLGGSDAAYTGYTNGTVAESVKHMTPIGKVQCPIINDTDDVVVAEVGLFVPRKRYGVVVILNNMATAAMHTDMAESAILLAAMDYTLVD